MHPPDEPLQASLDLPRKTKSRARPPPRLYAASHCFDVQDAARLSQYPLRPSEGEIPTSIHLWYAGLFVVHVAAEQASQSEVHTFLLEFKIPFIPIRRNNSTSCVGQKSFPVRFWLISLGYFRADVVDG